MATRVPTGPSQAESTASVIRAGMVRRATDSVQTATAEKAAMRESDAYKNGSAADRAELDYAANQKINDKVQDFNHAISTDDSTTATLDRLNYERTDAYNAVANLRSTGTDDPAAMQAAQNNAMAANQRYLDATSVAAKNGGSIPGTPTTDAPIPVTEDPSLPVPPIPPDQVPPVPGNQNTTTDANFDDRQIAHAPNTVTTTATNTDSTSSPDLSSDNSLPVPPIPPDQVPSASSGSNDPASQATSPSDQAVDNSDSPQSNVGSQSNPAENVPIVKVPDQRIRLTPKNMGILGDKNSILYPLTATLGFMFPYTPTLQYSGNVSYGSQSLTHANQDFKPFSGVQSQTVTINGIFTAQTQDEAKYVMACLHFLRTVTKMRFGQGSAIGLPPPVLVLNGYGLAMFNNLSVIVTTFSMDLPNNVDYIKTTVAGIDAWIPTYCTITMSCTVQNTPNKQRTFNWDDFASGALLKKGGWS